MDHFKARSLPLLRFGSRFLCNSSSSSSADNSPQTVYVSVPLAACRYSIFASKFVRTGMSEAEGQDRTGVGLAFMQCSAVQLFAASMHHESPAASSLLFRKKLEDLPNTPPFSG
ncbi:hypothetical protein AA313_de0206215 [Arthrobotrys entomopaga]|nr:hypothetical protein AA313_de0206215 [Arthrobotrys entomopaga]